MMGMPGEKYLDTPADVFDRLDRARKPLDLFLCESQRLVLRPDHLYRFQVDPTCEKCKEIEAEGKP